MRNEWTGFVPGVWEKEIDVRDFIQKNYTPYDGDDAFLAGPDGGHEGALAAGAGAFQSRARGGRRAGPWTPASSPPSPPTRRAIWTRRKRPSWAFRRKSRSSGALMPYGGIRMAQKACEDNGYHVDPEVVEFFTTHRKTHNAGVFDAYTPEMRACRSSHIITACRTPTAGAASSAITAVWRCTAWTG